MQRAYKLLALQHHPDRGGSEERFKALSRAYKRLSSEGASAAEYEEAEEHDELSGWRTVKMPFTAFRDFRFHEFSESVSAHTCHPHPHPHPHLHLHLYICICICVCVLPATPTPTRKNPSPEPPPCPHS